MKIIQTIKLALINFWYRITMKGGIVPRGTSTPALLPTFLPPTHDYVLTKKQAEELRDYVNSKFGISTHERRIIFDLDCDREPFEEELVGFFKKAIISTRCDYDDKEFDKFPFPMEAGESFTAEEAMAFNDECDRLNLRDNLSCVVCFNVECSCK